MAVGAVLAAAVPFIGARPAGAVGEPINLFPTLSVPAALSTTVAMITAVPGTPAVPKLPSTEASAMIRYLSKVRSIPAYCAMNTEASAG